MSNNTEAWQIIHIPDKPPIPPDQQPTVNVFASVIEPKFANILVRRLNQIAPLENHHHVKRVQKKYIGGKIQLSVVLCLACKNNDQLDGMPLDVQELVKSYQLSAFITKVSKFAASSKEQWEEQCKLWPTSYHPPTYNIDGITGFSEEDSQLVFSFIRFAVELAKSGDGLVVNAAVIVDPLTKRVIASARDEVFSWNSSMNNTGIQTSSFEQTEACISNFNSNRVVTDGALSNGSTNEFEQLCAGVSCLYPWQWSEQQLCTSNSCSWHPLRHAALVAIESSAVRDRQLFPGLGEDKSLDLKHMQSSSTSSPAKRQTNYIRNVEDHEKLDTLSEGYHSIAARPYLCTGYDIYLVWEPCTMCAMALVHQRIRRIFYAFTNPHAGALGSVHRLQGEKSLNHHYAVFRVLLPEEVVGVKL